MSAGFDGFSAPGSEWVYFNSDHMDATNAAMKIIETQKSKALDDLVEWGWLSTTEKSKLSYYELLERWKTLSNAWDYLNRTCYRVRSQQGQQ